MGGLGKEWGVLGKDWGVWENWVWIDQTGLGLYIGNMLKSMKGASKAMQDPRLVWGWNSLEGHLIFVPVFQGCVMCALHTGQYGV